MAGHGQNTAGLGRRGRVAPWRSAFGRLALAALLGFSPMMAGSALAGARADETAKAMSLYAKGDYMAAAALLTRLAEAGHARAQAMLGLLYEYGHGVPQDFAVAAWWYGCAAERGDPSGQYLLGVLYDKGRGVPRDAVLSQKWLILAASRAGRQERETYARIRDAVASKMSRAQINLAQQLALQWSPSAPMAAR